MAETENDSEGATGASFNPVYIYKLSGERYERLMAWWEFYQGTQHDHCRADWGGRTRPAREPYLSGRVRMKGFAQREGVRASHDDRRPNVQLGMTQRVVDRFTETTCGRPAALVIAGDEDSTLALGESMSAADAWDAINELETIGGACGSAAIVSSVVDGEFCDEVLFPFEIYVRAWADRRRWIPAEVIHQVHVDVEQRNEETGRIETVTMVKTRLWTETHCVTFKAAPLDWPADKPLEVEDDDDAVLEHHAGRCPVVWHQNTKNTRAPEGQPDMRTPANLELCDMADRVASHAVKATRNNTEPTIHRKDRDIMFMAIPAIAKGGGNEIRTSEAGDVKFLETDGASVEMAWKGVDRLALTILRNTNCVIYDMDLDMASRGTGESGEALQQRASSMHKRCNRKRVALGRTIKQIAKIRLSIMREMEISSENEPEDGTVILPPRCIKQGIKADTPEQQQARMQEAADSMFGIKQNPQNVLGWSDMEPYKERYAAHKLGPGTAVVVRWPPYNELTPGQMQAYIGALTTATGKTVLSQQTGIELAASGLGLADAHSEKRRMLEEKEAGVHMIQPAAMENAGEEAEVAGADTASEDDGEAEEDAAKPGAPPPRGGTTPA